MGTKWLSRDCPENGRPEEETMPNLVTELLRDYQRNLIARRLRAAKAKSPAAERTAQTRLKWPPVPDTKPHKPAPDHDLRNSHF
jgi:hypothetical protein